MKKNYTIEQIEEKNFSAVALGTFDGLHKGHMAVIMSTVAAAQTIVNGVTDERKLLPAVFTFLESPHGEKRLETEQAKENLLEQAGIETAFIIEFSEVREISPEDFVKEILFGKCSAKKIFCGRDFRFGSGARGDTQLLEGLCKENNVELQIVDAVNFDGEKISSTRIRKAIENGEIERANEMLGREFNFSAEVIHGNHIGATLGTPTINQLLPNGVVMPKFGVYATLAVIDEIKYYGVSNIGVKPTVGSDVPLCETWFPEYSGDLYGREIEISLVNFIRPEKKFSSLDELKAEIFKNADTAKKLTENMLKNGQ